jgi:hypothetical protein
MKVVDMRVAIRQRNERKRKDGLKKEREAKVAALSEKQRVRREHGINKRNEIREARLAKEQKELRERQLQRKKEIEKAEAAKREEQRRLQAAAAKALETQSRKENTAPAHTATRNKTAATQKERTMWDMVPTLEQMRKEAVDAAPMPSLSVLCCALQCTVVYADKHGLSAWGDSGDAWSHPSGWLGLVERFNQIYRMPGSEPDWCDEVMQGEYNVVFVPKSTHSDPVSYLPPIVDREGNHVPLANVVFRVTRPDSDAMEKGPGRFHRYKSLQNLQREVHFTLHGAANGFAPQCYAVVLFPALNVKNSKGEDVQLYGTIYVMRRAQLDLGTLLDDHAEQTRSRVDPHSMEYVEALRKAGRRVAAKMMPVVFRQSRLGVLSFDSKPGNYVFADGAEPQAIDFDSAMYAVVNQGPQYWEAHLLLNLTLLTAHVRCYRHPAIADGWASAVRDLMIELCSHSRGERWLHQARVEPNRKFKEMLVGDAETKRKCFEMVSNAYFVQPRSQVVTRFPAKTGQNAAPLLHQLVRFCLHGSIKRTDGQIDRALGDGRGWVE